MNEYACGHDTTSGEKIEHKKESNPTIYPNTLHQYKLSF